MQAQDSLERFWFQEVEKYLGYKTTREGIKLQARNVEKMQAIAPPKNKKELCGLLVMINYNRDILQGGSCHGSSSDTTANQINPYYLIG